MPLRTVYLFYFPRVKESFSDNYSPAYGMWYPEAFRSMPLFRSINALYENLEFDNNRFFFGGKYKLINSLPKNEGLDDYTYKIIFKGARQLSISRFNKLIKLKFKKKGDLNLRQT